MNLEGGAIQPMTLSSTASAGWESGRAQLGSPGWGRLMLCSQMVAGEGMERLEHLGQPGVSFSSHSLRASVFSLP